MQTGFTEARQMNKKDSRFRAPIGGPIEESAHEYGVQPKGRLADMKCSQKEGWRD